MGKHLPIRLVTRSQPQRQLSFSTHARPGSESRPRSESEPSAFPWLSQLKSSQLQHLARNTGIQSSGTKPVLVQRISTVLQSHTNTDAIRTGPWRILSIDMGIRNLAFAHLVTPSPLLNPGTGVSKPELHAWRRLDVSDMESLDLSGMKPTRSKTESEGLGMETDAFAPNLYAKKAYTLISTLLAAYQPTHILIERQRFRSGGGSAVQEWTLRVGVFEGMLYAILHALQMERKREVEVRVHGVEPKRVVGYWEMKQGSTDGKDAEKKKLSAREVKKVKIDTVGRWLDSASGSREGDELSVSTDGHGISSVGFGGVSLGEGQAVRELVDAYVRKWKGERSSRKKGGLETCGLDIGKLDDLADCLLQGVTWLEWQVMRERLVHQGIEALDGV